MSTKTILACAALSVVLLATQTGRGADPIVYYSFDELGGRVTDESGNGNDGTPNGGITLNDNGRFGKCFEFNGIDAYVELQRPVQNDFTIMAWIKTERSGPGGTHAYQGSGLFWSDVGGVANDFIVGVLGTKLSFFAGNPDTSVNSNADVVTGEWMHIAAVRDTTARTIRVYIDGKPENSVAHSNTGPLDAQAVLAIGGNTLDGRYYAGLIDEVKIYDTVLTADEIRAMVPPKLKAYKPSPADGAIGVMMPLFQWTPGETALFDAVYLGTTPELTEADKMVQQMSVIKMYYHTKFPLLPGQTYYWRVDAIEANQTVHTGNVWSFTIEPLVAYAPKPADETQGVFPTAELSWRPGKQAVKHQVYFSSNFPDVNDGTAAADQGVVAETTLNLGLLRSSTTYYWRVDEIKTDASVQPGEVWSFTTADGTVNRILYETWQNIGGGTAISDLTGNASYPANPTTSELVDLFQSPVDWADNYGQRLSGWLKPPQTGDYTFWIAGDDAQQLWLSTDVDPANAVEIANVPGWTPAFDWDNTGGGAGNADAQESDPIPLQAGQKYFIMALGKEGGGGDSTAVAWQGPGIAAREVIKGEYVDTYGLAPLVAFNPYPANGAVDTLQELVLEWAAGEKAQQHEVYFGDDADAVAAADTSSPLFQGRQSGSTFDAGALEWGKTFYWRVDEINEGEPESPWVGRVWSFTTADFLSVDDFESYTDNIEAGEAIWQTWIDGLTNGTGSIVGYFEAPFAEQTIVHSGRQSMPLDYNNIVPPYYSEAELPLDPAQDWTVEGVSDLTLYIRGNSAGFVETAAGQYRISANSSDIWGTSDNGRFVYKQLNGDGAISAKVLSVDNTNNFAKGGVMIRASLDPASAYAFMFPTPSGRRAFQNRPSTAASAISAHSAAGAVTYPCWVKVERKGNEFTAYYSTDGNNWIVQPDTENTGGDASPNPQTIFMTGSVYIGLALSSNNSRGGVCFAEFSDVLMTGSVSGQWKVADLGDVAPGNDPADLYVAVQDSSNKIGVVVNPDPAAVNALDWVEWKIPLTEFGVNTTRVKKLFIGLGNRDNPTPGGAGLLFIDDIRVTKPESTPEPDTLDE